MLLLSLSIASAGPDGLTEAPFLSSFLSSAGGWAVRFILHRPQTAVIVEEQLSGCVNARGTINSRTTVAGEVRGLKGRHHQVPGCEAVRMGRSERPIGSAAGPIGELATGLRQLRDKAGKPSYRELCRRASFSSTVLSEAAGGQVLPTLPVLRAFVRACGGDVTEWEDRWKQAATALRRDQKANGRAQSARRRSGEQPDSAPDGLIAPAAAPRHLPAVVSPFVGRAEQLDWLSAVLERARIRGETTVITISGTAGVGKSALAIRWAHEAADHFPDGQFYANLRGFDQASTPVLATHAIREFLDAFGVPAERIPASSEAQALLYRSLMADKRVLIILDNARDPDQVRALLPASSGCVVLATSRNALAGLAATHGSLGLTLNEFSESEARELLAARLPRTAGEADATAEVIELCGRLPLALAIVSARIQCHPALTIADLVAELRGPPVQLEALRAGEVGHAISVSEVFSWSCRSLTPGAVRLFRLMALHPGPDIGVRAAASLAGISGRLAGGLLQELTGSHLLAEHTLSRFAFHDLLHSYAAEQVRVNVRNADQRAALRRVFDFYLRTAHCAASRLNRARDPIGLTPAAARVTPEDIGDREQALAWFRAEYRVLLGLIELASETGFSAPAWQLPWCLVNFFDHEGRWHDWVATHRRALAAAQRLGDQQGQAHTRQNLAIAYSHLQRHDDAHAELRDALRLYHELGNSTAEARCRLDIARTFELQGENSLALAEAGLALDLYQTLGHRVGIGRALNAVGWYCSHLGNFAQAVACCEQALAIHRETGNRLGQAATLDSLGHAHTQLSHYQYAVSCYTEALQLLGEDEHTYQRASVLRWLGSSYRASGDQVAASQAWREAKTILDELRHPEADLVQALLDQVRSGDLPGRSCGCPRLFPALTRQAWLDTPAR
jgi:tetratricopeptide (TPR) repeat protein